MKIFTFDDLRNSHRKLTSINGDVYDITDFIKNHPGGDIISTSITRDATILFESHHSLCDSKKIKNIMDKLKIGIIKDYKPIITFDTEFSRKLISRVKKYIGNREKRGSFYSNSAIITIYFLFLSFVFFMFYYNNYIIAICLGIIISICHLLGHAGNHWSLSKSNIINKIISLTCTNLWGLREKNWEFSHLISHHCYNYTDNDYIMEQHVPFKYFRIRECDKWKSIHKYQHLTYLTTPITSFFIGSIRLDCFPWIILNPILSFLKNNKKSIFPAPQFFASSSNCDKNNILINEDGVGPKNFYVNNTKYDDIISIIMSNIIWAPLFFYTWNKYNLLKAILLNSIVFGTQSSLITNSLLTQHLCENIKLNNKYKVSDDWYIQQIEGSTTINSSNIILWLTFVISYQTEHHLFPSLDPLLIKEIQPIVKKTCEEFNVQYNYFSNKLDASKSVYKHFKNLSIDKNNN